jgi:hypothetical protein
MKNNKILIAVVTFTLITLLGIITSIDYYKYLFTHFGDSFRYGNWSNGVQSITGFLLLLLDLVLITLYFTSTSHYQDKVYKLLRYLNLMSFFLYMPYLLYVYTSTGSYFYKINPSQQLIQVGRLILNLVCIVLFLRAKPQSQPAPIDLTNYELVSYTSMGHRFVHHLLDMLFLIPIFLFWQERMPDHSWENPYLMQVLYLLVYLIYCFLSEAIFRQTLGKIATNSCVTAIGHRPSVGRIIIRTLARLIPFDSFSFLFGANWHDKTSSTAVVYVDTWEKVFADFDPTDMSTTRK